MTRLVSMIALCVSLAHAQPDFTNVDDFLNGRRQLLKVDDIAIMGQRLRDPNLQYYDMNISLFKTQNSTIQTTPVSTSGNTASVSDDKTMPDFQTAFGRFWNGTVETAAVAYHHAPVNIFLTLDRPGSAPEAEFPVGSFNRVKQFLVGDYNGDGFSDVAIALDRDEPNVAFFIATASDTSKPSAPKFGPVLEIPPMLAMSIADLNCDGRNELLGIQSTDNGGIALSVYTVDPTTLAISLVATLPLSSPEFSSANPITKASVAAGKFRDDATQQAGLAYGGGSGQVKLKVISFNDLQPQDVDTIDSTSQPVPGIDYSIMVKTGRLLASKPYDYLVFNFSWIGNPASAGGGAKYLRVVHIDPQTLKLSLNPTFYDFSQAPCSFDFTIGNFDQQVPDPTNPGSTTPGFDKQIAYIWGSCSGATNIGANIITLNEDFSIKSNNGAILNAPVNDAGRYTLIAGDIQGRSIVLGAPVKIELNNNIQTSVVAAAPPSHVDYITPAGGTHPVVLNVSAMPEGFRSTYNTSQTGKTQTNTTWGSSWSFAATESVNATLSVGDLDEGDGTEAKLSASAAQKLKNDTDNQNGTYSSSQFDISSSSYVGDNFWYNSSRLNVWIYPVIGQTACPNNLSSCQDTERVQKSIVYSAPDGIQNASASQDTSNIYQPPWEYGNIFSYPNNLKQLTKIVPDIQLLSSGTEDSFQVSGGPLTINATWTGGSSSGSTTAFKQNYSFDSSLSTQAAVGVGKVGSIGGGYTIDVSGSYGLHNQTTTLNQLDATTGMSISRPAGTLDALYNYSVTPYLFARSAPPGVVDASRPANADVSAFGSLRSAFTADVLSLTAGAFWNTLYGSKPDIGLSHPNRWALTTESLQSPVPQNCRPSGANNSQQDCFDVHEHQPDTPLLSESLYLQGFFINNAQDSQTTDPNMSGPGPNLLVATAGTIVTLQVRVYNFSLASMPTGSQVHVQFYGLDTETNTSFKIGPVDTATGEPGDVVLGAIPPVGNGETLNWVYARTNFDTTKYAGKNLHFWVVVWAETGSGSTRALLPEIGGHGLTGLPPNVLANVAAVPVEMNPNVDGSAMVTYSNNVGIFNMPFYVAAPSGSGTALASASVRTGRNTPCLLPVQVSPNETLPFKQIVIRVPVQAGDVAVTSGMVRFFDGHPEDGGTQIRIEHLNWLEPGQQRLIQIPYRPTKPGLRRIWAILNQGAPSESVRASQIICVGKATCAEELAKQARSSAPDPRERP